jgi:hypothetical protein
MADKPTIWLPMKVGTEYMGRKRSMTVYIPDPEDPIYLRDLIQAEQEKTVEQLKQIPMMPESKRPKDDIAEELKDRIKYRKRKGETPNKRLF